jgi:hypothetical protein
MLFPVQSIADMFEMVEIVFEDFEVEHILENIANMHIIVSKYDIDISSRDDDDWRRVEASLFRQLKSILSILHEKMFDLDIPYESTLLADLEEEDVELEMAFADAICMLSTIATRTLCMIN